MEQNFEKELHLPRVSVQLATVKWAAVEDIVPRALGYNICQRLSEGHSPIRIGNINASEAFPRIHSVGLLPPGCPVRLYPVAVPFRVLNCAFEKAYFESVTQIGLEQWEEHTGRLVAIRDRRIEIMMQEIYAELVQPGFGCDLLIEAACTMILVEIARYGHRLRKASTGVANQGLTPWQLRRINERIEVSLEEGYPGVAELAALCGISHSHLMRTFKAATGWPIHKFIAEERLRTAKRLLVLEDVNAKEISARLGFRSPAYFATAFRRMTGQTPSDYRREARVLKPGSK
jgi:AraC family transcriptional regulator